jgi:hypothetical protein
MNDTQKDLLGTTRMPDCGEFDFNDLHWRMFPPRTHQELGLASNELWYNDLTKTGALVGYQSTRYPETAISKAGLDYVHERLQEGKIPNAIVVLARREGQRSIKVRELDINDVVASLERIPPRDGEFGPYWWFYSNGSPQRSPGTSYNRPLEDPPY